MIKLRSLLTASHMGLRVRACPAGLDSWVRWARVINDAEAVGRLTGGELVLTDGSWRRSAADSDRFVCALAQRGVIALAMHAGPSGDAPDVVDACERWRVVLLEVPAGVAHDEVADWVVTTIVDQGAAGHLRSSRREGLFLTALQEGDWLRPALDVLQRSCDVGVWLLTGGAALAPSDRPPPTAAEVRAVAEQRAAHREAFGLELPSGAEATVHPLRPRAGSRVAAHLVFMGAEAQISAELRAAIDQALGFLGLELECRGAERRLRRACAAEFVRRTSDGEADAEEIEAWARALDVPPLGHVACFVVQSSPDAPVDVAAVAGALEDLADSVGAPCLALTTEREACAFVFVGDEHPPIEPAFDVMRMLLESEFRHGTLAFGTSSVIAKDMSDVIRASMDARQVCRLDLLREPEQEVAEAPPANEPLSALLLSEDERSRVSLESAMLGPLIAYDETHGSELMHTLDVFLSNAGHWAASADELGVHVNTLRYRLARVEKVTGRKLGTMADRVDFYVALRTRVAAARRGPPGAAGPDPTIAEARRPA